MPDESEFLCGDWVWDPLANEMRHYPRRRKGHADSPDAVEQLARVSKVTLYRWSQTPMQNQGGGSSAAHGRLARIVVAYQDGRSLEINEADRDCAALLAATVASAAGVDVSEQGAPSGRRGGNLPQQDEMGRLRYSSGRVDVVLDEVAGELAVARGKRLIGTERRRIPTREIRRLDLTYDVQGNTETYTVWAIAGADEERIPVAGHSGFEGWADAQEWREFTSDLARSLGVEARL